MITERLSPDGKIKVLPAYEACSTPSMIESALDRGEVYVEMASGKLWLARRNGQTKRWKKDPARFEIPAKAGFRATFRIDERLSHLWVKVED